MRIKNAENQIAQERRKAYLEKLAIAKSLKSSGIPMELIKQSTGLSDDEINKL